MVVAIYTILRAWGLLITPAPEIPSHKKLKKMKVTKRDKAHETPVVGAGRILLMDDDTQLRKTTGRMLERIGYEAIFAKDGAEAIRLYKLAQDAGKPFDAVIMDLSIPNGLGGEETIKKLIEIAPEVKAIISSGETHHPVMVDFQQYGFCGFLPKPYGMKQLNSALDDIILQVEDTEELDCLSLDQGWTFQRKSA